MLVFSYRKWPTGRGVGIADAADELIDLYVTAIMEFCSARLLVPFVSAIPPATDVPAGANIRFEWLHGSLDDAIYRTNLLNTGLSTKCEENRIGFFDPFDHIKVRDGEMDMAKHYDVVHIHSDHWPEIHRKTFETISNDPCDRR